ncbi:MAG: hypothetical protein ACKPKO_53590, partial [Candidatus Fonsibacter sp.]
ITTSNGTITGRSLAITGTVGRPQIPTAQGCYIGQASTGYTAIELVSGVGTTYQTYIDFTELNVDFRGRIIYTNATNDFQLCTNSMSTAKMTLNSSGLSVGGTFVSASDKRLKLKREASNQRIGRHQPTGTSCIRSNTGFGRSIHNRYPAVSSLRVHSSVGSVNRRA